MARLIGADELLKKQFFSLDDDGYGMMVVSVTDIISAPTVEQKKGRWITHNKGENNWCECSECNTVGSPFWKRCPVCESKMDGGAENDR